MLLVKLLLHSLSRAVKVDNYTIILHVPITQCYGLKPQDGATTRKRSVREIPSACVVIVLPKSIIIHYITMLKLCDHSPFGCPLFVTWQWHECTDDSKLVACQCYISECLWIWTVFGLSLVLMMSCCGYVVGV